MAEVGVQRDSKETEGVRIWNVTRANPCGRFVVCAWPAE